MALGTPTPSAAGVASERTFKVAPLGLGADLPNPLRGQYRWLGAEPGPGTATANDVYYRDQVYWGRIEKSDNAWDFSLIDAGLADAASRGGKFGFRVMAYCPGCWMESRTDLPPVTPPFVPRQADGHVPDWSSAAFLAQWRELMAELGRRYGDDPRLGYVDVGGYGSYGEWHVDTGQRISDAAGLAVVDAVASAFPAKHVLLNTMTPVPFTLKALKAHRNLGLRTDSLGCPDMYSMVPTDARLQRGVADPPVLLRVVHARRPGAGRRAGPPLPRLHPVVGQHAVAGRVAHGPAAIGVRPGAGHRGLPHPAPLGHPARTPSRAGSRITVRTSWVNQGERADVRPVARRARPSSTPRPGARSPARSGSRWQGLVDQQPPHRQDPHLRPGRRGGTTSCCAWWTPSGYSAPMHLANAGRSSHRGLPRGVGPGALTRRHILGISGRRSSRSGQGSRYPVLAFHGTCLGLQVMRSVVAVARRVW